MSNPSAEPNGLCLVCAKEMGLKPVEDMLKKMNISDEDIEQMSDQFMDIMALNEEAGDAELNDETFDLGTAPAMPFLKNIFGSLGGGEAKEKDAKEPKEKDGEKAKKKRRRFIEQYCTNLTEKAKMGKIDVIIGRDKELYRTIQILSRRSKNNPCLIGEPGVGKTAIAEGLALQIANGIAPARLLDKEIYLLDLTGLVAGTQFRGQFESRVKGLVSEIKEAGNIILFIDEIHNLVGAGDSAEGSMNAANILKPALSRGEIQVIGATTFKEYRKYIEKDAALERRFQPVTIEEPSLSESEEILLGVKGYYEGFHNVVIPNEIVKKAVLLSERYVTDRYLPDKAIDLLDEACACASLANKAIDELYIANKKVAEYSIKLEELEQEVENPDYEKQAMIKADLEKYKKKADELCSTALNNTVTDMDIAKVLELWTGIPATKIQESDLKKLATLEDALNRRIIGQGEATKLVASAVKRSRVKTSNLHRPASFIFVGPTGVGKTELVKVLSEQLFNTPETLIRLDMSEFMEKHSVSRIIGAPPGYVGYDEAGQLTEKVRRKPYSVVLFDEIEKAHPDVLNILLQILDDGRVTDAQGRTVNFENTVIVMTSNAGSDNKENLLGFGRTETQASKEKALKALETFLRPEFIARVDEIVVFSPLSNDTLIKIAALMLDELKASLKEKLIDFSYDKKLCEYLANKCDGGKRGARELRNLIRREIENKIVDIIVDNSQGSISAIKATANTEIKIETIFA
ncbi:MAG: ATP-dependent Clp protease ATP-binding subunit [Clostridia bacterium]|nr:ATP-dependent Clp protease ATP-binding subunit [Clostridia bacterium]